MKIKRIVTLLLILICGAILVGCQPDYSSLQISFDMEKIEILHDQDDLEVSFKVENYKDLNLKFNITIDDSEKAIVVENSLQDLGNGNFKFKLKPNFVGDTNLRVSFKGIQESEKVIPVYIIKKITDFDLNSEIFIKRNEEFDLNSDLFNLVPQDTNQKAFKYEFEGETPQNVTLQNNKLFVSNEYNLDQISLKVTSLSDDSVTKVINFPVVSEVNLNSFKLEIKSQKQDNPDEFENAWNDFYVIQNNDQNQSTINIPTTIEFVKSEAFSLQKLLNVSFDFWSSYKIEISSTNHVLLNNGSNFLQKSDNFVLELSAEELGKGTITLKVIDKKFSANFKTLIISTNVITRPTQIAVNGNTQKTLLDLYTNNQNMYQFALTVFPYESNADDYNYKVNFYSGSSFANEFNENNFSELKQENEHFDVYYGGDKIQSGAILDEDLTFNKLTSNLAIDTKKSNDELVFVIKITCYLNQDTEICNGFIYFRIFAGAENIYLAENIKNNTIYLNLDESNNVPQTFNYLKAEGLGNNDSIGKLSITSVLEGNCNISQQGSSTILQILPQNIGTSDYIITTANGKSLKLTVVVFRQLSTNDIIFTLKDTSSSNIASYENYTQGLAKDSLKNIVIKGKSTSIKVGPQSQNHPLTDYLWEYEIKMQKNDSAFNIIKQNNNSIITANNFAKDESVEISVNYYYANDFALSDKTTLNITYNFSISCINYIKDLNLSVASQKNSNLLVKEIDIYNKTDLSYINQNLATVYMFLDVIYSQEQKIGTFDISNFKIYSSGQDFTISLYDENVYKIGSIGYLQLFKDQDSNCIASFTYDYNTINDLADISIMFSLNDDTKQTYSDKINLIVKEYIDVDSIWLTTPVENIYLANTQNHSSKSVGVYMLPDNAMCKDIQVLIDAGNNSNCISFVIKDGVITFSFVSAGNGVIRIFPVSKMKTSSFKDQEGNYYPHLTLNFVCADGKTQSTALKLSSFEDLKNIDLNSHYYVDSPIDCKGNILQFGKFSGSIRGTFEAKINSDQTENKNFKNSKQVGSITNFTVASSKQGFVGLFEEITTSAEIYNIIFEGSFASNLSLNADTNIGLLCAKNNGNILNVTVKCNSKNDITVTNLSSDAIYVYMGYVAGENAGNIIIDNNKKSSTLLVDIDKNNIQTVNFKGNINSSLAGLVGLNIGAIKFDPGLNFAINLYGVATQVNLQSNANVMASVVAVNESLASITNVKAIGQVKEVVFEQQDGKDVIVVKNNQTSNVTAGFVGTNHGSISNNTSRVFVRGYGTVSGFVGTNNGGTISDNVLESADDQTRIGIDASLIVGYNAKNLFVVYDNADKDDINNNNNNNNNYTYFTREYISSEDTLVVSNLPLNQYYGDCVNLTYENDGFTKIGKSKQFETKNQVVLPSLQQKILLSYKEALNSNEQNYIDNSLNTYQLLQDLGLQKNLLDINLKILTPTICNLLEYGNKIEVLAKGNLIISLKSSLNYQNSTEINLNILNYYDNIKIYENKDKSVENINNINLINKQTKIIYFEFYAEPLNYLNSRVILKNNSDMTLNINNNNEYFKVEIQGQNAFFTANKDQTFVSEKIIITPYYSFNFKDYYVIYQSKDSENVYKILDSDQEQAIKKEDITVSGTIGIENIKANKHSVTIEPSKTINFDVAFDNYSQDDKISISLKLTFKDSKAVMLSNNNGVFSYNDKVYFILTSQDAVLQQDNNYIQKFALNLQLDDLLIIDEIAYLDIYISSVITKENDSVINVEFIEENITSVLVTNYNYQDNFEMVTPNDNGLPKIDQDKQIITNKQFTTAEYNVMNIKINSSYAKFDYVDIKLDYNDAETYMALLNYEQTSDGMFGSISNQSLYVNSADGLVLRVYKSVINKDKVNSSILDLNIIYSVIQYIPDKTVIPVILKFYKNQELIYQTQTSFISKSQNSVSLELNGKDTLNNTQYPTYQIVSNKEYILNVTPIGYTNDEVMFDISDPGVAKIERKSDTFVLTINNNINYIDREYYQVIIKSYGQKTINGVLISSIKKEYHLNVYDILLNNINTENGISIKVNQDTDIRNKIADSLEFEYSKAYEKKVSDFVEEFKENKDINYYLISKNQNAIKLSESYEGNIDGDLISGFKILSKSPKQASYKIAVEFAIKYENGIPVITDLNDENAIIISTLENPFSVEVYVQTLENKPKPIYTLTDLNNMIDNENYRLMQDIEININQFEMIKTTPKTFDGNGYKFILTGSEKIISSQNKFALFEQIKQDCVFKNIIITFNENITLKYQGTNGVSLALLTVVNNGTITNCRVESQKTFNISMLANVYVSENSFFGMICTDNNGYITHSQIESNMTINGLSFGAFCARNTGSISSSYVKNSKISSSSQTNTPNITVGGFVCENTGNISSCYIEGNNINQIYSDYINNNGIIEGNVLFTTVKTAGFVYRNGGKIVDCYSNIPVISSDECSGFVGNDFGGTIERAFSLSKLQSNDTSKYGFIISYNNEQSKFSNCFFVIENNFINYNTSPTNYKLKDNKYVGVICGIEPLTINDFNVLDKNGDYISDNKFSAFSLDNNIKTNGVWFIAYDYSEETKLEVDLLTYNTSVEGFKDFNGNDTKFTAKRLQLVSPNIFAHSKYDIKYNSDNTDYDYWKAAGYDDLGSKTNPYLITNATEFEGYLNQRDNSYEYFRIINDIDYYKDAITNSKLYSKTLYGFVEGNNMKIQNYSVNTMQNLNSAGLFSQIGKNNSVTSVFKNVSLAPDYINLPNSIFVGGFAGSVVNSNIINVSIENTNVKIIGSNIVGGLIGRTYGQSFISGVFANISAIASKINSQIMYYRSDSTFLEKISYNEFQENKGLVSYAGAVIGYLGGQSTMQHANIGTQASTLAMSAGLVAGGIGSTAVLQNTSLTLNSFDNMIVGYAMAGMISGEVKGTLKNISINSDVVLKDLFVCSPIMPICVGGVSGYAKGATIEGFVSQNGYSVIATEFTPDGNIYSPYLATFTGGVFGVAKDISVSNINIGNQDLKTGLIITGGNNVGGLIGKSENCVFLSDNNINILNEKTFTNKDGQSEIYNQPFAYVRFVEDDSITGYIPIQELCCGLVCGTGTSNITPSKLGSNSELKFLYNNKEITETSKILTVTVSNKLLIKYEKFDAGENDKNCIILYAGDSDAFTIQLINLNTNKPVNLNTNTSTK